MQKNTRGLRIWLALMIILVVAMILLGGATRLTNSGLSITEWKPITGALPPLSHQDWVNEFAKYQKIPEFSAENADMDLASFKFIYFMEWSHRQLGRTIGMVYFFGLLFFGLRRRLKADKIGRFLAILLLIGLQVFLGWWMVSSGLGQARVDVSHYRLAVHLGTAMIILGVLLWTWLDVRQDWPVRHKGALKGRTGLLVALVFIQILAGAIVAGTHSGLSYNTWPMMDGKFIPPGYLIQKPVWINLFENTAAIQFNHRVLAYLVAAVTLWLWWGRRKTHNRSLRAALLFVLVMVCIQISLGILTLIYVVPMPLALWHQGGAILVFLGAIWAARAARVHVY